MGGRNIASPGLPSRCSRHLLLLAMAPLWRAFRTSHDWYVNVDPWSASLTASRATTHNLESHFLSSKNNTLYVTPLQPYAMGPARYDSRVKTAVQQAERGIERSLNAAADANGVARSTVKHRAAGRPERNPWAQTLLHKHQETQVIDWIRELETWGFPVRVDMLRQTINSISDFPPVRKNWATRFIKRNDLVTTFSRCLDSQRAFNNDPDIVTELVRLWRRRRR